MIRYTLDDIETIVQRHSTALRAVEAFDFLDAANLLAKESYYAVLHNAGFNGDIKIAVSDQSWWINTTYTSNSGDADDDNDEWGLPNDSY